MLNQVVYTRCKPCRDLLHNGEVLNKDGYGVFSMSEELLSKTTPMDRQVLEKRLQDYNASVESKEPGLIRSYEFVKLPGGQHAILCCIMRANAETVGHLRTNGSSIRTNSFVVQAFVGEFSTCPSEWFGSGQWNAAKIPAEDYYLDGEANPVPQFLPQVSDKPDGGSITGEKLQAFIRDGRAGAVKNCLHYLLEQYEKPEEDRQPILIKDTPENVELWIAAIEAGFSAKLAAEIPFATNLTKLGTNINAVLFAAPGGMNAPAGAGRTAGPGVKTRPLFMIAGYHPKDRYCASVCQTQASRFVLLDGETGKFGIVSENTGDGVRRKYYQAVTECSADIRDFREVVLPSIPLNRISAVIPDLYDSYQYLLDEANRPESWNYKEAYGHLDCFSQFGICENEALAKYLLDRFLSVYARKFLKADGQSGFPLLMLLEKYAKMLGRDAELQELLPGAVEAAGSDSGILKKLLACFPGWRASLVKTLLASAGRTAEKEKRDQLLDTLFDCVPNEAKQICETAVKGGLNPAWLEASLSRSIRRRGTCSRELEEALFVMLDEAGDYEQMGIPFYDAWLSCCDEAGLEKLIKSVKAARLPEESEKQIFAKTESRISPDFILEKGSSLVDSMEEWSHSLRIRSAIVVLQELYDGITHAGPEEEDILGVLKRYTLLPLTENAEFFDSHYFEEITLCAGEYCSGAVNQAMMCLFEPLDRRALQRAAKRYVGYVLQNFKGKRLSEAVVGLAEASVLTFTIKGVDTSRIDQAGQALQEAFESQLPEYYRKSLPEDVDKIRNVEDDVRDYLDELFEKQSPKKGGLGGGFSDGLGGLGDGLKDKFKKGGSESGLKDIFKGIGGLFGKK